MDVTDAAAVDAAFAGPRHRGGGPPRLDRHAGQGLLARAGVRRRRRPAPGTCWTPAWPTAYAAWSCPPAARPTATTPTTPSWLTEDDPVRGNEVFAYSHHKRLVEEMLAALRESHPELEQVRAPDRHHPRRAGRQPDHRALRAAAAAQDPRRRPRRSSSSGTPTSSAIICRAVTSPVTGIFNVAGDGALTIDEIAAALGKRTLVLPEAALKVALGDRPAARPHAVRARADDLPQAPAGAGQRPAQGGLRLPAVEDLGRGVRGLADAGLPGRDVNMRVPPAPGAGRTHMSSG